MPSQDSITSRQGVDKDWCKNELLSRSSMSRVFVSLILLFHCSRNEEAFTSPSVTNFFLTLSINIFYANFIFYMYSMCLLWFNFPSRSLSHILNHNRIIVT